MKKKLVFMLGSFAIGGAEHMVYELIKHMDTHAYDIQVLCLNSPKGNDLERTVEALCPVRYLNEVGCTRLADIARMIKTLDEMKPDIIHAHLGGVARAPIWTLLRGKPLVITAHTKPEKAFPGMTEKLVRFAVRFGRTRLVAVSEENTRALRKYFRLGEANCSCVNNGIDLERFAREVHDGFTLIHVGRQDDNKNQAALIRCFARLHKKYPETRLLLLGDGLNHQRLKDQTAQLQLEDAVIFTGNVSNTQDYYAVSDLYVQCSHREAMPLSVLEAMAAGLPVVSTDVGGLRDVVQDNGLLVPDNDEEALYCAIEQIYTQTPEQTAAMRRAADRIVQGYSSGGMARAYEKIYNQLLTKE